MTSLGKTPAFRESLLVYLASALLLFSAGAYAQHLHLFSGLILSELACVVAPALLYTLHKGYHVAHSFHLHPIQIKTAVLAVLIAGSAFFLVAIVAALQELILPRSAEYQEVWEAVLQEFHQLPFFLTLLLIAVLPGVCEEFLFRGFLLNGMRAALPDTLAIVMTGVLFGIFHLDPYRLLPVSLLGMLFGYMTVKTGSIIPGIIAHATNNGIAISLSYFASVAQQHGTDLELAMRAAKEPTFRDIVSAFPVLAIAGVILFSALKALPRVTLNENVLNESV